MTNHLISVDNEYEISYEDGQAGGGAAPVDPGRIGFWLREKNGANFGPYIKITAPFSIKVGGEEISIVTSLGQTNLYSQRDDNGTTKYAAYDFTTFQKVDKQNKNMLPRDAFSWSDLKKQMTNLGTDLFPGIPLSKAQKGYLNNFLTGEDYSPTLVELKANCTSLAQYQTCIEYLLGYRQIYPEGLLNKTRETLRAFEEVFLTREKLHELKINGSGARYDGHLATLDEIRQYVRAIMQKDLKATNSSWVAPGQPREESAARKAEWNQLAWPGEDLTGRPKYKPIYQREASLEFHQALTENLQAIVAVHHYQLNPPTPPTPPQIKRGLDLAEFERASNALQKLLSEKVLNDHVHVFVGQMSGFTPLPPANSLKTNFLIPLYQTVQQKIAELKAASSSSNSSVQAKPSKEQFKMLRVDQWDDVDREATRADFLNEQFKNPQAIFLNLDQDPNNPLMTPVNNLCVLNLPIGNDPNADIQTTKDKIKEFFAQQVYPQIRFGRTIIVPSIQDKNQQIVPKFGTSAFADSKFMAELRPFILEEIQNLQKFCAGGQLGNEYLSDWNNARSPLSLPEFTAPQEVIPPPSSGIETKNFLSAGFRTRIEELLGDKLIDHTDEITKTRTFRGTLSNGVEFVVHKDKMVLNEAAVKSLSPEAYRESMAKMIDIYIKSYEPGKPPPTTALGTPKQIAVIKEILQEKGVPIQKPATPPPPPQRPGNNRPPVPNPSS